MNINYNIREKIIDSYQSFPAREKRVAEFVVDNYEQMMAMSNIELASAVNVSNTTVVRFAQRLGYKGYLEFRNALKAEQLTVHSPYASIRQMTLTGQEDILPKYFASLKKDIDNFLEQLEYSNVDNIAKELLKAECVYLVGIGSDSTVATYLNNYLPIIGIKCVPIYEQGLAMREKTLHLTDRDVVILSAVPTIVPDEKWIAGYCKESGAKLVIITNSEITAKVLGGDYCVIASESMTTYYNSCVLPMILCNILLIKLRDADPKRAEEALKKFHAITGL